MEESREEMGRMVDYHKIKEEGIVMPPNLAELDGLAW